MITPSSSGIPRRKRQPNVAERLQAEIIRKGKLQRDQGMYPQSLVEVSGYDLMRVQNNSSSEISLQSSETDYSGRNRSIMVRQPDHSPGAKSGRHNNASQRILGYLRENANVEIPYTEIQKELGLPSYTVSNAVSHLISKGIPVSRPLNAVVIFRPTSNNRQTTQPPQPKPSRQVYEFVGNSSKITIVRGEDDELYVLKPLFGDDLA